MCVDRLVMWYPVCWTHIRGVKTEPWNPNILFFKVTHGRRAEGIVGRKIKEKQEENRIVNIYF